MAITSSEANWDGPVQFDGTRQVREVHRLSGGGELCVYYTAEDGADIQVAATTRAPSLLSSLADSEAVENVERDGPFTLNHQTGAQFAARFREMVRSASQSRACYLAWWLLRRIAQGHTTDAAVRSAFGMTAAQWNTFKSTKAQPRADAWTAVLAAKGE